jgi:hypothetical protein
MPSNTIAQCETQDAAFAAIHAEFVRQQAEIARLRVERDAWKAEAKVYKAELVKLQAARADRR